MSVISGIATTIVKTAGVEVVVPIVEEELVAELQHTDHQVIARKVVPPEATIRAMCAKTGADPDKAVAAWRAMGDQFATAILSMSPAAI